MRPATLMPMHQVFQSAWGSVGFAVLHNIALPTRERVSKAIGFSLTTTNLISIRRAIFSDGNVSGLGGRIELCSVVKLSIGTRTSPTKMPWVSDEVSGFGSSNERT